MNNDSNRKFLSNYKILTHGNRRSYYVSLSGHGQNIKHDEGMALISFIDRQHT